MPSGVQTEVKTYQMLINGEWVASKSAKTFPVYDPYPPGILPSDLNSELARVAREVDVIEARALAPLKPFN